MTQASARSAAPLSAHWSVGPWVPSPEQPPRPLHRHHRAPTTDTSIRRLHCLLRRQPHRRRSITTRTERKLSLSHDAPKALTIASLRALPAFRPTRHCWSRVPLAIALEILVSRALDKDDRKLLRLVTKRVGLVLRLQR